MVSRLKNVMKRNAHKAPSFIMNDQKFISALNDHCNDSSIANDFFADENYNRILKCLNHGYQILSDLIDSIRFYRDDLDKTIESKKSFSKHWKSKIEKQDMISSYNTTKLVQKIAIESCEQEAALIELRSKALSKLIEQFQEEIDRLYINVGLTRSKKHFQSHHFELAFKNARDPIEKLEETFKQTERKKKKAESELRDAQVVCENLRLAGEINPAKIQRSDTAEQQRRIELEIIEQRIISIKEKLDKEQLIYREKALVIFRDCQSAEKERLDLIRRTLVSFIDAVYPSEHQENLTELYRKIRSSIEEKQSSDKDLKFWAETFQVTDNDDLPDDATTSDDVNLGVTV